MIVDDMHKTLSIVESRTKSNLEISEKIEKALNSDDYLGALALITDIRNNCSVINTTIEQQQERMK